MWTEGHVIEREQGFMTRGRIFRRVTSKNSIIVLYRCHIVYQESTRIVLSLPELLQ